MQRSVQRHVQRRRWGAPLYRKQCDVVAVASLSEQQFECLRTNPVDGPGRRIDHEAAGAAHDIGGQVGELRGAGAQRPAGTFDQAIGIQQDSIAYVEKFGAHRETGVVAERAGAGGL